MLSKLSHHGWRLNSFSLPSSIPIFDFFHAFWIRYIRDSPHADPEDYVSNEEHWVMPENLRRSLLAPINYGSNTNYPEGDYATRSRIWKSQQTFVRNLIHFFAIDESVPESYRLRAKNIRMERDAFSETRGYPSQLYIREVDDDDVLFIPPALKSVQKVQYFIRLFA